MRPDYLERALGWAIAASLVLCGYLVLVKLGVLP